MTPRADVRMRKHKALAVRVTTVLVLIAVWEAVTETGLVRGTTLPSFRETITRLASLVASPVFLVDLSASAREVIEGLLVGGVLGVVVGVLIGVGARSYAIFEPLAYYLGAVPKIVLLPIFLLALGSGIASKAGIGAISAVFPVIVATALAVRRVDPSLLKAAKTMRASRLQIVTKIYVRAMFADVLNGLRLGLAVAIAGCLLAETAVAQAGLGFRAIQLYAQLDIAGMYGLLLLVFCGALLINVVLDRTIRHWSHWQGNAASAPR